MADGNPQLIGQGRPRVAPYREIPSSQFVGKLPHQVCCNCLHTMTQLLEDTEGNFENQGLDDFMMYLGRGMKMCESVLACIHCNACVDNSMLFTSNARQLVSTAQKASSKLLLAPQSDRRRSYTDEDKSYGVLEMRDDRITFGRYIIERSDMKARLVHHMILLHLGDLQQLLAEIKQGVGVKKRAEELLADAENDVAKLTRVIHELAK